METLSPQKKSKREGQVKRRIPLKAELCGLCSRPLQYEFVNDNLFAAGCPCGRKYSVILTYRRIEKSLFGGDTGHQVLPNGRDIIDYEYEGNWQQKYQWEPRNP
jgi:hypothetical protein